MKLWLRRLGWLAVSLAFLIMLAWLVLPGVLQSQGERRLTELLGRQVRIGQVHFRPWSLELTVRDLVVAGSTPERPLLRIGRIYANAEVASVWRLAPILSAFELDAPELNVARVGPGRYDFDDVLARLSAGAAPGVATAPPQAAPAPDAARVDAEPRAASEPQAPASVASAPARPPAATPSSRAPAPKPQEDAAPPRFALHNLQLRDGSIRFDDQPVGRTHEVQHLVLTLPFLSNLPSDVEVKVEPRLAFALDEAVFDSGAQSTPFAQHRSTSLRLRVGGDAAAPDNGELDLSAYVGYLPHDLPARLERGFLAAELDLGFSIGNDGTPIVALSGQTRVRDVAVVGADGAPLAQWRRLGIELKEVRPISRRLTFGEVRLEGAELDVDRDAEGGLNLTRLAGGSSEDGGGGGWQVAIEQVVVDDSRVRWRDATTRPAAGYVLDDLSFGLRGLRWPMEDAAPADLHAVLRPLPPAEAGGQAPARVDTVLARLDVDGEAAAERIGLNWRLADLQLAALHPYLAPWLDGPLRSRIDGRLRAAGRLDWSAGEAGVLQATLDDGEVEALRLLATAGRRTPEELATVRSLRLSRAEADVNARRLSIGRIQVQAPSTRIERAANGRLNVEDWVATPAATPAATPGGEADAAPAAPWQLSLAAFSVEDGQLRFTDRVPPLRAGPAPSDGAGPAVVPAPAPTLPLGEALPSRPATEAVIAARERRDRLPAIFELRRLRVSAEEVERAGSGALSSRTVGVQAALVATAGGDPTRPGRLDWQGRVATEPLRVDGRVVAESLPLQAFERYVAMPERIELQKAQGHYRGRLSLRESRAGLGVSTQGELKISDLHVATRPVRVGEPIDDLLSWRELGLAGLKLQMEPGRKPRVELGQVQVSDFFSRLVVTEAGRFQLLDIVRVEGAEATGPTPPPPASAAVEPAAASGAASAARTFPVTRDDIGTAMRGRPAPANGYAPAAAAEPAAESGLPVDLAVGSVRLENGRVAFTDRSVRPNYSADLSELNGQVGAFRSGSVEMAPIEVDGVVARTGRLRVEGQVNPSADPLALDVRASATDVELPPLSPYAGKYAGYQIDRGKLKLEVHYDVKPDGRLDAQHHLVLDQLRFGDRVDSPEATRLPVRLAVALLQDRHGVIDLELPVSGSLQNPEFSIVGIVFKMIGNLLVKAVTAPFALLTGGSEDLGIVQFAPGSAVPTPEGQATVDRLAKALLDRPNLRATLTGASAAGLEAGDLRHAMLDRELQSESNRHAAERRSRAPWGGAGGDAPPPDAAVERERLLRQLYRDTDLPDKPRNFLGIARDIPPEQMEAQLLAHLQPGDDDWRELALARAIAVRDALVAKGLPVERLFLGAPKVEAGAGPGDDDGKPWTPRTTLELAPS